MLLFYKHYYVSNKGNKTVADSDALGHPEKRVVCSGSSRSVFICLRVIDLVYYELFGVDTIGCLQIWFGGLRFRRHRTMSGPSIWDSTH